MREEIYLTPREREVFGLIAQGYKFREIAIALDIGRQTVMTHVFNARIRLDAKNIQQAVAISIRNGFIQI